MNFLALGDPDERIPCARLDIAAGVDPQVGWQPHKDPSDRFIVAEARRRNAVLVTCDALMIDYARAGNAVVFDARV